MARSYKAKSGGITTATTDKPYKRAAHKAARHAFKLAADKAARLAFGTEVEELALPDGKLFGDPWLSPKDGHNYRPGIERK